MSGQLRDEATSTLGDLLKSRRLGRFVGRAAEVELFRSVLSAEQPPFSVLFIHGPGGIGKSSLLEVMTAESVRAGAAVIRLDADAVGSAAGALLDSVRARWRGAGRAVIFLDAYERIGAFDDWVRTELVPSLPSTSLTVIAGRTPPGSGWRADPAWRDLLRAVSLRNLNPDESRLLLERCGVPAAEHDRLVEMSHGHPLGLSLLADVVIRGGEDVVGEGAGSLPPELVSELVRRFVDVVPSAEQRRALEVCALARVTTEALLRDVVGAGSAYDLFGWLRDLSFVQSGPEGLRPHELARDVLDVDLRWRDVDGYKSTFRSVRAHVHRRLAGSRGREQQRAIVDEKYLFRNLPSILSPVDWSTWGFHDPEQARPGDHGAIVDLVRQWEGAESAAIADRWLAAQPEGFFVIRDEDGTLGGFLGLLDLTKASPEDRAADPGATAAWAHAQRTAPPRVGEAVLQSRFLVDRKIHQGPSPAMNAGPILIIQRYLQTPSLAWDFLTLAEPDRWNDYFAVADMPRVVGADFTVGGRQYGLFAHDFRAVPVDTWLELVTERALEQDFTLPPPHAAEALALSREDFDAAVRQGLRDLRRPDLLARNPLLRSRLLADVAPGREADAVDLEGVLSDAVDALREDPRDDKLFRAVERTYVRPAGTQEAAAEALGVPFSSYRRHLTRGVERIVGWLWEREIYGTSR